MPVNVSHTARQVHGLKLLEGKVAVIYGAAGGVGTAVAKAFAREGAMVFLAGRTESSLKPIAEESQALAGLQMRRRSTSLVHSPSKRISKGSYLKPESLTFPST